MIDNFVITRSMAASVTTAEQFKVAIHANATC